ncbi:MAG: GGDEF domain-containing protein [Magnetococcales bacterium]|nr:GGDEF domain-containing protein [Magnetococcales bacterium]
MGQDWLAGGAADLLVTMTGRKDRLELVAALVAGLNKLTGSRRSQFFDIREEFVPDALEKRRRMVLVSPLDPEGCELFPERLEGVAEILAQPEALQVEFMACAGQERVIRILYDRGRNSCVLIQDFLPGELNDAARDMGSLLWGMFQNLQSLLRDKDQDPLTGLLNRRSFDETIALVLDTLHHRPRDNRTPGSGAALAVFDIDHFKRINDSFGHTIGDEVLILFARCMENMFRHTDRLYRFGGEEFLAILTEVDLAKAAFALERFRQVVARNRFPKAEHVTVSIGFVMVNQSDLPSALIEKADQALYFAKEHGRNQVQSFDHLVASGDLRQVDHTANDVELWA